MHFTEGKVATPGRNLTQLYPPHGIIKGRWPKSDQKNRTQDNFTCMAKKECVIFNLTFNVPTYAYNVSFKSIMGYAGMGSVEMGAGADVRIKIDSEVPTICCLKPWIDDHTNIWIGNCSRPSFQVPTNGSSYKAPYGRYLLSCVNGTRIKGRSKSINWFYVTNVKPKAERNREHIRRIHPSCQKVGFHPHKTIMHVKIHFPSSINHACSHIRQKRAWYDTLLGGYGAATGVLNGIDIETLASRLSSTGQEVKDVIKVNAMWLPSGWTNKMIKLDHSRYQDIQSSLILNYTRVQNKNLTEFINWTVCTMRSLHERQEKNTMQTRLMTGNEDLWRKTLNISSNHTWIYLNPYKLFCKDTLCWGDILLYKIVDFKILCKFITLPLIMEEYFWFPEVHGKMIDSQNLTYDMSLCTNTFDGYVCGIPSPMFEPCFSNISESICHWTLVPIGQFEQLTEIGPQSVCIVSNVSNILPNISAPVSACFDDVTIIKWKNQTIYLYSEEQLTKDIHIPPPQVNISYHYSPDHIYEMLLGNVNIIRQHLQKVNKSEQTHQLYTLKIADKMMKIGNKIEDVALHHWWDIFTGYSPSAQAMIKGVMHPILALIIILAFMTLWNCFVFYKLICKTPKIQVPVYHS